MNTREGTPASLFKYCTQHVMNCILNKRELRLSAPKAFNDPFDSQWDLFWQTETVPFKEHYRNEWKRVLHGEIEFSTLPRVDREEIGRMRMLAASVESEAERERDLDRLLAHPILAQRRQLIESSNDHVRVFCMSAVPDSILMWSHYAEHHRGAVLELSTEGLRRALGVSPRPVEYVPDYPPVFDPTELARMLTGQVRTDVRPERYWEWLCTKFEHWKYEREWRFVTYQRTPASADFSLVPLAAETIHSVRLGCCMTEQEVTNARALVSRTCPQSQLLVGRKCEKSFALRFTPV